MGKEHYMDAWSLLDIKIELSEKIDHLTSIKAGERNCAHEQVNPTLLFISYLAGRAMGNLQHILLLECLAPRR